MVWLVWVGVFAVAEVVVGVVVVVAVIVVVEVVVGVVCVWFQVLDELVF